MAVARVRFYSINSEEDLDNFILFSNSVVDKLNNTRDFLRKKEIERYVNEVNLSEKINNFKRPDEFLNIKHSQVFEFCKHLVSCANNVIEYTHTIK